MKNQLQELKELINQAKLIDDEVTLALTNQHYLAICEHYRSYKAINDLNPS